jgi:hypothetical protein
MSTDGPACDRPQAHECPGAGCTYPLRDPGRTGAVTSVEDLAFRMASHALFFAISEDQFARFREFIIRRELATGKPAAAAIMRKILDPLTLSQIHLEFLQAVGRLDPEKYRGSTRKEG